MAEVAIIAVPFPAQGHLNQLLHFCLHLSSYTNVSIHYACSATHNRQAKDRIQGWDSRVLQCVQFHNLELPEFDNIPPDSEDANKFPSHLLPAWKASMQLQAPLASLLQSISSEVRRVVVVHDSLMSFASHEAAKLSNAESYRFPCIPTFQILAYIWEYQQDDNRPELEDPKVKQVLLTHFKGIWPESFIEFCYSLDLNTPADAGCVINTSRAFDQEFIDLLEQEQGFSGKKIFAVGPLNPLPSGKSSNQHECLAWLDKQPPGSVLYVSFGTMTTLSERQIDHLAEGLRRSEQKFIWVLKDADRGDIYADGDTSGSEKKSVPEFDKEKGLVVRDFAPQLEILAHRSTAAFLSHCGWNSSMESLSMGIPVIAWPMHSDQPRNSVFLREYLNIGVLVREWDNRTEIVSSERIAEVIKRVMVDDEGKDMRMKARAIGEAIRDGMSDSGSSKKELECFVAYVTR